MTTSSYPTSGGPPMTGESGSSGAHGAKEQAQQAAGTATDEGRRLAGVAQEQVGNVADEARSQVQGLMEQASREVDDQARQQKDRLAGTVRTFGEDLENMASQGDGMAAQVAREVSERARTLSSRLEDKNPSELLGEVRDFARRRPGTFLLGALAAGVVAGRLARGAKDAQSGSTASTGSAPDTGAAWADGPANLNGDTGRHVAPGTSTLDRPGDPAYDAETTRAGQPTGVPAAGGEGIATDPPQPGSWR